MDKLILSILCLSYISLFSDTNIDIKIQQIQNASPKDRVRLMNEFKKTLLIMNKNTRIKAITALQTKQNNSSKKTIQNDSIQNNLEQIESVSKQIGDVTHIIDNTGGF